MNQQHEPTRDAVPRAYYQEDTMSTMPDPLPSSPSGGGEGEEPSIENKARAVTELEHATRWLCYREMLEDKARAAVRSLPDSSARETERRHLTGQTDERIRAEARVIYARRELYRLLGVPELGA